MRGRALLFFVAAVGLTTACESSTEAKITYSANLTGGQEVPANQSTGTGTWTGTLDENNVLTYNLSFSGLGSNATLAHIHGPAAVGVNAGIIVDFAAAGRILTTGATSGSGSGTINLTAATSHTATVNGDSLRKLLNAGLAYVNVHTALIGGGELRGQITRQ